MPAEPRKKGVDLIADLAASLGVDLSPPEPRTRGAAECPRPEHHTPCPTGYLEWHDWAEKKAATHRQKRCPACGLWKVWEPKRDA